MRLKPIYPIFIWLALAAPTPGLGQIGSPAILGTVTDEQGNVIYGAEVTARNISTGSSYKVKTGKDGRYFLPALAPGRYEVRVEASGFRLVIQRGIELSVAREAVLDFKLNVGNLHEQVAMEMDVQHYKPDATVGKTFDERQITQLPLNTRNVASLLSLDLGVSTTSSGATKTVFGGSIAAARAGQSAFSLNGADIVSSQSGRADVNISADAIQEFRFQTGILPAEIGRGGGSSTIVALKSGTNDYRGGAYFGLRDNKLQARDPFGGLVKPSFDLQQFGGTIGGKIWPDRVFFFFSAEHVRDDGATTVGRRDLDARRIIPGFAPTPSRSTSVSARIDAKLSEASSLFGQYLFNRDNGANPGFSHDGKLQDPSNFQSRENLIQRVIAGWTQFLTVALVNELRLGISSIEERSRPLTTEPQVVFPSINVGANYLADRHSIEHAIQIKDDLTWIRSVHSFKFGVDYRHISLPQPNNFNLFGQGIIVVPCDFPGDPGCPNATADSQIPLSLALINRQVLTSRFHDFGQLGVIPSVDNDTIDLYAQDEWRLTPKLTFNLGLRWEYDRDFIGKNQFNKSRPRISNQKRSQKRNNPDPRIGIVWVLKIPIRGGIGWFHQTNFMATRQLELLADGARLPIVRSSGSILGNPFASVAPDTPPDIIVTSETLRQPHVRQALIGADVISGDMLSLSATFNSSRGRRFPRLVEVNRQPDGTRLNPGFGSVLETQSLAKTAYDGLEVKAEIMRWRSRRLFGVSYVISRSLDEDNDPLGFITTVSDPTRPEFDRGPAPFESRHNFNFYGAIELPRPIQVTFAPFLTAYSRRPVEIIQNHDFSEGVGSNAVRLPGLGRNAGNREVRTGADINRIIDAFNSNASLVRAHGGPIAHVDPEINLSRPYLRFDLSVYRHFYLKDTLSLEVRANVYNVLNRVNVTGLSGENTSGLQNNVESPNFGQPLGVTPGGVFGLNSSRAIVLSAKLVF